MLCNKIIFGCLLLMLVSIVPHVFCAEEGEGAGLENRNNGSAILYDIKPKCLRVLGHFGAIDAVSFNKTGDKVLVLGSQILSVWSVCEEHQLLLSEHVIDACFSGDGSHVIAKTKKKNMPFVKWEFKNRVFGNPMVVTSGQSSHVVDRREHDCEIAIDRCAVLIVNRRTKRAMHTLSHKKEVSTAEFNYDGTRIASGLSDGSVYVWKIGRTVQEAAREQFNKKLLRKIESERVTEALRGFGF